jgi:hypothetical protein
MNQPKKKNNIFEFVRVVRYYLQSACAVSACIVFGLPFWGCATFNPQPLDKAVIYERAETQTERGVRVTAAVLSAAEAELVFDRPLYKEGIQPVWLEIENKTDHRMWFAQVSVDRNYYAPLEVAYLYHSSFAKATNDRIDQYFHEHIFRSPISSGQVRSGFVFTQLEMGTKAFNVDVIGEDQRVRTFTFLIPVEGLQVDHRKVNWNQLYEAGDRVSFDNLETFRNALEALPCCTSGADGTQPADPVNVVIIGDGDDLLYALLRSGWDETAAAESYEPTAQLPWEFRYQPVKSLYLFERFQDAAFRKSRSTLNERNQLRLWLSPFDFQGRRVWVGQISRIIRRSAWDAFIIEPDVDEARSYLLQDLWYAQALSTYGYVKGTGMATLAEPRKSLNDDDYFTDGLRLVIWVSGDPVSLADVRFVAWEKPAEERRKLLLGR